MQVTQPNQTRFLIRLINKLPPMVRIMLNTQILGKFSPEALHLFSVDFEQLLFYINRKDRKSINSILEKYGLQNSESLVELIDRLTVENYEQSSG